MGKRAERVKGRRRGTPRNLPVGKKAGRSPQDCPAVWLSCP